MFSRIKKALTRTHPQPKLARSTLMQSRLSEWAGGQGLSLEEQMGLGGFALSGKVGRKTWRLESGRPSRDFIRGEELRARADLGLGTDVALMLLTRPLKELLEHRAFDKFTDDLQTVADPSLGEEMRWLTTYPEVHQGGWAPAFGKCLAVYAANPAHATQWLDATLVHELLHWPSDLTMPHTPMVMMVRGGKLYLRMQYSPADMPTLEHAVRVFVWACESALATLAVDIPG